MTGFDDVYEEDGNVFAVDRDQAQRDVEAVTLVLLNPHQADHAAEKLLEVYANTRSKLYTRAVAEETARLTVQHILRNATFLEAGQTAKALAYFLTHARGDLLTL